MRAGLAALLLLALAAAGGCGATRQGGSGEPGRSVFATSCSGCHSLIGNESRHLSGGDLRGYGFTRSALVQYTIEMPLRHALTRRQVKAVVGYLLAAQGPRRVTGGSGG